MRRSLVIMVLALAVTTAGVALGTIEKSAATNTEPAAKAFLLPGSVLPKGKLLQMPGAEGEPPLEALPLPGGGPPVVVPVPPPPPPGAGGTLLPPPAAGLLGPVPPCPDPPPPVVSIKVRVDACAPAGQQILYKICVENNSPSPAHHVLVRNPLPPNAKFVTAIPKPTVVGPEIMWALGTMPCGCRKDITLILEPTCEGDIKNCARVQFEHGQCVITHVGKAFPFPTMPYVEPPGKEPGGKEPGGKKPPDVTVGKLELEVAGPDAQLAHLPVDYTITLRNAGEAATDIAMINCDFPKTAEFIKASDGGQFMADRVAWLLGKLGPGEARTVTLTWKAKAPGKICLDFLALDTNKLAATATKCTTFKGASGIGLKMFGTTGPVAVGDKTSYQISVLNQGSVPVGNIVIKGFVPKELKFLKATGPDYKQTPGPEGTMLIQFDAIKTLEPELAANYEVFVEALGEGIVDKKIVYFKVELTADPLKAGGPVQEVEATTIIADEPVFEPPMLKGTVEPAPK